MKDLMIDIETLDTKSTAIIVQIGACYFDRETGIVGKKFLVSIDIKSCLEKGMSYSEGTMLWWFQQDKITFMEARGSIDCALSELSRFADNAKKIWCHTTFDIPILQNAFEVCKLKTPWHFTDARDIRTLADLSGIKRTIDTVHEKTHDALEDCLYQVEYCTDYFKEISK